MSPAAILIVEDNPITSKMFRVVLEGEGLLAREAGLGAAALAQLEAGGTQLVVMDMVLPDMSGLELASRLRRLPGGTEIPVIALSGFSHLLDSARQRPEIFDAFLFKPVEPEHLLETVRACLPGERPAAPITDDQRSERQLAINVGQAQRAALQSAQLSILGRVANALTRCTDVDAALADVLATCLDAAGIDRGVLYRTANGVSARVSHDLGFAGVERAVLENVFGHPALLARAVADSVVLPVTSPPLDPAEAACFLARAGVASAFFVPLLGGGRCVGALLLGSSVPDPEVVQLTFCRALGAQIGQALVLADAFASERGAREVAEEASRAKSRFLGMISHELLTPLTSIRLQLDRLDRLGREVVQERERPMLGLISRAEQRLRDLVNSQLEYARVESGRLQMRAELVDVGELMAELIDDLQQRAQSKGLALVLTTPLPEAAAAFRTDRRIFRLIASNLVDNAIKFTDSGWVQVSIAMEGNRLRLTVADSGCGIPISEHSRIFDPFEQLEKDANKHTPGVGLGLALVKRLAEAFGGRVELWSQVGEGSRFSLITPELAPAKEAPTLYARAE